MGVSFVSPAALKAPQVERAREPSISSGFPTAPSTGLSQQDIISDLLFDQWVPFLAGFFHTASTSEPVR